MSCILNHTFYCIVIFSYKNTCDKAQWRSRGRGSKCPSMTWKGGTEMMLGKITLDAMKNMIPLLSSQVVDCILIKVIISVKLKQSGFKNSLSDSASR